MEVGLEAGTLARAGYDFNDWIAIADELGIRSMELWVDRGHFWPQKTSRKEIEEAVSKLNSRGIRVPSICPIPFRSTGWRDFIFDYNLASQDENLRSKAVEWYKSVMDLACKFEAETVVVLPGKIEVPEFMKSKHSYRQYWERVVKSMKECGRYAEDVGIYLGVENAVICNYINLPWEMRFLIEEVGSDHVKAFLDIANANVFLPPEIYVRELSGALCNIIHATDNDGAYAYHLPIGMGKIDYRRILKVLRDADWDGYLMPEIFQEKDPVDGLRRSKETLEEVIKSI